MKKNKKSNIVLFSVLGLAAISIGTVGFATWITGLDKKTENVSTTIVADGAKNETYYVDAVLGTDNSISLTENTTKAANSLIRFDESSKATDLTITFTTLRVIVSSGLSISSLNFTLGASEDSAITDCTYKDNVGVAPTNIYDDVPNSGKKTYFEITKSSYTVEEGLTTTTGTDDLAGYTIYEVTNKAFTFKWGSMFNYNSPSEYYVATENVTTNLKTSAEATKVLNHMKECLIDKKLKLTITATLPTA